MDPEADGAAGRRRPGLPRPAADRVAPAPAPDLVARRRIALGLRRAARGRGVIAGFVIRVPYTTIAPGEALSLPPLVHDRRRADVSRRRAATSGCCSCARPYHVNLWQYVRARLDPDIDLVKDAAVNPGKLTPRAAQRPGSAADGRREDVGDRGRAARPRATRSASSPDLIVSDLVPGPPRDQGAALGRRHPQRRRHNDHASRATSRAAIAKHKVGDDGRARHRARREAHDRCSVRSSRPSRVARSSACIVSPRFTFPVKVNVDTTGIGGPSAGSRDDAGDLRRPHARQPHRRRSASR